ncbi:MAG TPA: HTH-type transcriptional repressor FabR [Nevskiaceae bacterium]|nr:HTH-type transcriptional repressor FabR [Nevskiaceae bacterium]
MHRQVAKAAEAAEDAADSRGARKQRTREALLEAALRLMSEGRGLTSLGLREITREAGVVPTSFYRHFRDIDELGLALVEEGGLTLRRLLREARKTGVPLADVLRRSVMIYREYLEQNRLHFMFIAGERHGGSRAIRDAIRSEVRHFTSEMAADMRHLGFRPELPMETLQLIAGLVVNTMLNAATDILDLPPGRSRAEDEMMENFIRQLRLIFLGALQWQEKSDLPRRKK